MNKPLLSFLLMISSNAVASISTPNPEKSLRCWGEDNIVITINAARTKMKYEVEGETTGAKRVTKTVSGEGYKKYMSEDGVLTISTKSDNFVRKGNSITDATELDCK